MNLSVYIAEAKREARRARKEPTTPDSLVRRHLALPVLLATEAARRANLDRQWLPDLIAAGNVALVEAAQSYDPEKGTFPSYARRRIAGAIWGAVTTAFTGGAIGPGTRPIYERYMRAVRQLARRSEEDSLEALARESGLQIDTVRALQQLAAGVLSLDMPVDGLDGDTISFAELQADPRACPEDQAIEALDAEQRREELARALACLSHQGRLAISLVTGYRGVEQTTVGDVLAVMLSYGRQHHAREKLQRVFREGKADARKLGFEPDDARGIPRGGGPLAAVLTRAGKGSRKSAPEYRAEDLWRLLIRRFGPAEEMEPRQLVGS